uniref:E4 protein n=1 Tax=Human papillomavirus TaxID=10566 RepID=A0A385PKN5_9PAPI|nr:MAG: E4 protein [Human papillomavirus]
MIMIQIIHIYIQIGMKFIIRTFLMSGTKCLVKWIIMDYTMMMSQGKECIFKYFLLMPRDMVKQDNGLLNTKIQLFPLLLLAHQSSPTSGSRASPPSSQGNHPDVHHRRKDPQEDLKTLAKRAAAARRQQVHWDLDDENDKENQNPNNEDPTEPPENEEDPTHLPYLLKKWERDINRFREQVYHDLEGLKKRLGIQTSF